MIHKTSVYHAVAYNDENDQGIRFSVKLLDGGSGVLSAAKEAERLQKAFVFVEDEKGREVYDGPVTMCPKVIITHDDPSP